MKNTLKAITVLIAIATLLALSLQIDGCKPQGNPSIYDPNWKSLPQPVVDSISPRNYSFAGVGQLTIYGKNFSDSVQNDGVFFNSTLATIVSASQTQLVVNSPNVVGDSVQVRVYVIGAVDFSPPVTYKMLAAVVPFGKLTGNVPVAMTTDAAANLYATITTKTGVGAGTFKYAPDGTSTLVEPSSNSWSGLKVGPGGYLYMARNVKAIFRVALSGGTASRWMTTPGSISDFDFDQNKVLWSGGSGGNAIYSITQAAVVKSFPFVGIVHSVRVFGSDLYVAAHSDTTEGVWKFHIYSSDSLGAPQQYFGFTAAYGASYSALAISFTQDGDLYIGTDAPDAIVIVHPDGSYAPLYSGLLQPAVRTLAWGTGNNLYIGTTSGMYIVVAPKPGAPYYGAQ